MGKRAPNASCSFCRKHYRDIGPLVEGPGEVYICGECVELCQSIIDQERRRRRRIADGESPAPKPEVIRERFAWLIGGQDEVRKALVLAALRHYQRSGPAEEQPILLIGPTRSSRLFLARALAHALEVPFAEADAHTLSGFGVEHIEPLLHKLLQASDFDVDAAQRGILFVDAVDQRTTQEWLLRLWEKGVGNAVSHRLRIEIKVDRLLVLCGGAFRGLDDVISRLGQHPEQPLSGESLLAFGMAPRLVKRVAGIVKVAPLDEETVANMIPWVDLKGMAGGE